VMLLVGALRMIADGHDAWASRVAKRALAREPLQDRGHRGIGYVNTPLEGIGRQEFIIHCTQTVGHANAHDGEQP
jgi:hypothetical protein